MPFWTFFGGTLLGKAVVRVRRDGNAFRTFCFAFYVESNFEALVQTFA